MRRFTLALLIIVLAGCDVRAGDRVVVSPGAPSAEADAGQPTAPTAEDPAAADPAAEAGEGWQRLDEGMEFREISASITNVQIVRVDPGVRRVRVAYDVGSPGRVGEWAAALKSALVINGGYFNAQGRATALTIYDGVAAGDSYDGFGGMLAVDTAGALSLRSLREEPYSADEPLAQALQSAPMLVLHGEPVPQPNDDGERSRRSVVATDGAGRLLVIACSWPAFSLTELSQWLVEQDLGVVNALNLDGGSSTGLVLNTPERSFSIDSLVRVPQVLVVE
ncbi:MAG TPA: phosphodiester glycosidase family protein [Herpetosiphonaceae bacterium]|nr:phosphodiester glycosidase family protein [Herpetosiphonaceae bacterium]